MLVIFAFIHLLLQVATTGHWTRVLLHLLDVFGGGLVSFSLENIAFFVFKLDRAIALVVDELARELDPVDLRNFASLATTLVLEPFAFVRVSIGVVHHTRHLSSVLLHVALIKLAICEQDLNDAILKLPSFETSLDNFIRWAEKDALALRSTLTPLTFIDSSIGELTNARAMSEVILPVTLVDVSTG